MSRSRIQDRDNLLGEIGPNSFDRSIDKTALLIVEPLCTGNGNDYAECIETCDECQTITSRRWDAEKQVCVDNSGDYTSATINKCPCIACKEWYDEEIENLEWLAFLNSNISCPCKAAETSFGLQSENQKGNLTWEFDSLCKRDGLPSCYAYHPGAFGCIRSKTRSNRDA